jgi:alcohol dehydrogenase (cytochrome c)
MKTLVHEGLPSRGMPGFDLNETQVSGLIAYLRSIQRRASGSQPRATVQTTDGRTLEGIVLSQGFADLQLRTQDRIHLLRRAGERYREVTSETGWPGYNGDPRGNRYTALEQINPSNVAQLGGRWVFTLPNTARLEVTPVVVDGLMYVTSANECYALDAGSGRQVWRYRRPRTAGLTGNAAAGINRGVAVAGGRVFMATDHAHLIALDRFTGELLWETEMADHRQNYFATSAPLAAGGLVVTGVGGGELGSRGFVAGFDQATGKEAWRFWTVPKPGEPGSETWEGAGIEHGGAPTWFTGTYDPELETVYWPTGNPSAEHNGDDRQGDNLYSDCVVALDLKTGKLKWHYQFTPHDLWDWDATETPLLIDAEWQGRPRKLLAQANRNGFFYVLDRTDGKLLLAKPFIKNITWASGIGADGRPVKLPNQEPTEEGTRVCPALDGATNWFSPSYNPATGLFYVQTLERCGIFTKAETGEWRPGRAYMGGSQRRSPNDKSEKILRAIDLKTGEIAWELPQPGLGNSWGGTLATASGLVIFCEENGALMAADAKTGKPLWSFQTSQSWKASPMTYMFDGKQYIAVASGGSILAFSLP